MSNKVLLLENGIPVTAEGSANGQVLTWDNDTGTAAFATGGGGGSGTVTSVGLTGGTSGIVIGGTASPITTLGTYNLDAPQRFAFDTTSPIAPVAAGQMAWDTTEGSLNTMMVGGNVDAIVGQQLYQRAVNADTVTLTKGMVVYVEGSSGTRVTVKRAIASADLTSATIIGVVAESIAVNAAGFVITEGTLKSLSVLPSTSFADGDVVYLSPTVAGGLTATKPTAPNHLVMVGYCVKASNGAAGILLVKTQNGYELGELHDVYINSPTSGQILIYDATSGQTRWENASLGASNGIAVTPGASSLSVGLDAMSSPTLTGLTLSGLTASQYVKTNGSKQFVSAATIPVADVTGAAPLASPTFTGTPAAPTAAVDTNTTQVATTAYVVGQGYLKSATASSTYAPLASPTFTGTPSMPTGTTGVTQSAGNNTTALATTAFVTAAVSAASGAPYDVPAQFPGSPDLSSTLLYFKASRAWTLASSGHVGGMKTAPTGSAISFTVYKGIFGTGTSLGTITFNTNGTFSSTLSQTSFAVGEILSIYNANSSSNNGLITPYCTLVGTVN